ncbi:MFS transporter [Geodermatophilus sabuli]|uniref:Sugar phosphate permease n=1 Tax=Geodermatophilus sabuli TaxID=1564158 RepID=A0A285E8D5_9ACTN|nr:MFS transporter [Geodermatophilus sabuli]MBB3082793.1 MFS family permease [Geodermatophilus sabuli]SNX94341.1 Sugar phosphate permease [Geodermatophilus sabuli]
MTGEDAAPSRWRHLGVGLVGLVAACAAQNGLPFLTVALRAEGLSLATISLLVSAPVAGLVLTLLLWGALADRYGERLVLTSGLAIAAVALAGAASSGAPLPLGLWLLLAGAGSASVHAASGRLVLGWFPARQRGLAMGIRQMGQPIGVGVAALVLPRLAGGGTGGAFAFLAAGCGLAAVLIGMLVRDPARPEPAAGGSRAVSPYRSPVLWRVHAASTLLVVPQFVVAAFAFDYLVREGGWAATAAGTLLAVTQLGGAAARLGAGAWSDRVGSRLHPLRLLALAGAVVGTLLAGVAALTPAVLGPAAAAAAVVLATVVTVSPNGVAFTSVAEQAGAGWAGRALGAHNTAQNLSAAATVPLVALLVEDGPGYPAAFAAGAAAAAVAVGVVPGRAAERLGTPAARPGAVAAR